MSYCPEHGDEMVCRNPDDYDGLVYDCPEGHVIVYADGAYGGATHLDFMPEIPETCRSCGADTYVGEPIAPEYPWHRVDDDCRAIRTPSEDSPPRYCGCGHTDLSHNTSQEGYYPCTVCECEDFSLPEDDGLTKGGDDSTHHTQAVAAAGEPQGKAPVSNFDARWNSTFGLLVDPEPLGEPQT